MFRWTGLTRRARMCHTLPMTKPITFAHIADLQLGCNRFDGRLSRRREQDFYDSWYLLAKQLADRDDITYVVIVGDIFEYATPSTAARFAFQKGLDFLSRRFKKVILVSGNHESPRAAETMHPLSLYRDRPDITTVTDEATTVDGIFRVIPWHWGQPIQPSDLKSDAPVLLVHAACPVLEAYKREGARDFLPGMGSGYKYVALGDYHIPTQVAPNAWYSGSLEHTSFGEADAETGGWIVTVDEDGYTQERIMSKHRGMHNIEILDDYEDRLVHTTEMIKKNEEGMYRLIFRGVEPMQINPALIAAARDAGKFVKIVFQDRPEPPPLVDFGPATLYDQWHEFIDMADYGTEVEQVGHDILEEAIANEH